MHFGRQFEHETHFCEICAKTAEQWPEGPSCFCLRGTWSTSQRRSQLHLQYHNQWLNMGVWLWPRLSSSRRSGSRKKFTTTEKSASCSQQCQVHADHFFWHPRHCPQGIHTPWSNCQWHVLLRGFEAAEGRHSAQMSRQVEEQLSLIQQFLASKNITVIPHPTPPICLTLPPATFSLFPRWNYSWKGILLTRLRRCTQNRKRLSTHSHLRTSRDVWNHGKQAGIAVYMPKGSTSKETVETWSYGMKLFLRSNSPNFWVAPRIWYVTTQNSKYLIYIKAEVWNHNVHTHPFLGSGHAKIKSKVWSFFLDSWTFQLSGKHTTFWPCLRFICWTTYKLSWQFFLFVVFLNTSTQIPN